MAKAVWEAGLAVKRDADSAKNCDVSVIIPVYNRASLLRWPLASIAAQTVLPLEVIVVDDRSSQEEAALIRSIVGEFKQSINIRLLVTERNGGNSYSRNRGIDEARGKYIAILDSDDLWLPDKLEKQMRLIESAKRNDNRPGFSATGTYRVDSKGNILHRKLCQSIFDAARIKKSNYIPTSSVVVETSVAREINGFAEEMRIGSDWDFFIRLVGRVQFVAVPDPLSAAVDHQGERLSQNNPKTLRAMLLTRRKHMRGTASTGENSGFYRKIAQEIQAHGKIRTAKKFYIRSVALKYRDGWRRRLIEGWLSLYFSVMKMPSLRERRRIFYLRKPIDQRRDSKVRDQWDQDQKVIKALMSQQLPCGSGEIFRTRGALIG
jgi:glycosyltransferase involved in cell wall biosynthesis